MAKQFCVNGHDTFVVGRKENRRCRACKQAYDRATDVGTRRVRRIINNYRGRIRMRRLTVIAKIKELQCQI